MSHTIYHFQYKKENHPKLFQICSYGIFFPRDSKVVVNEPSVIEPLKFYCMSLVLKHMHFLTKDGSVQ